MAQGAGLGRWMEGPRQEAWLPRCFAGSLSFPGLAGFAPSPPRVDIQPPAHVMAHRPNSRATEVPVDWVSGNTAVLIELIKVITRSGDETNSDDRGQGSIYPVKVIHAPRQRRRSAANPAEHGAVRRLDVSRVPC